MKDNVIIRLISSSYKKEKIIYQRSCDYIKSKENFYVNVFSCATRKHRDAYYEATGKQTRSSWTRDAFSKTSTILILQTRWTYRFIAYGYRFKCALFFNYAGISL